jgi:cytochrome c556
LKKRDKEHPSSRISDKLNEGGVMRRSLKGAICGIMLLTMAGLAFAEFTTPDDAISYRQAVMTVIGEQFGRIAAVATGQAPFNEKALAQYTMVLRTMSELPWEACLMPGSYKGKTSLKASVMKEKNDFMAMARQFENSSNKLDETAKSGDLDAVKAQFGEVAKSCKGCHMTYRNL